MTIYQKGKLLILAIFSLVSLINMYNYAQNGRFSAVGNVKFHTLDTRDGTIYRVKSNGTGWVGVIND